MQKNMDLMSTNNENIMTSTINGAFTYSTTFSKCLDLFYSVGALRNSEPSTITKLIDDAYEENPNYTLRILFYARDIRNGLGERRLFRIAMQHLSQSHPQSVMNNLDLFPEYGRWDDLLTLYPYNNFQEVITAIVKNQLEIDLENMKNNEPISLLAKWLPSINTSNRQTRLLAKILSQNLKLTYKQYRQTLSQLRKYIDIIENRLRIKDYTFEYSKQPSRAMLKYVDAFIRNDNQRYSQYMDKVRNHKATINTGTLYPYDLVKKAIDIHEEKEFAIYSYNFYNDDDEFVLPFDEHNIYDIEPSLAKKIDALNIMWKNLPDMSNHSNSIAVIDTSGSMHHGTGILKPYQVAFSLGLYFAEHTQGGFANKFITFSENPKLVELPNKDFYSNVEYILKFDEIANTNIQKVFELILDTAIKNKLPQSELPENIYIISDMEFDRCVVQNNSKRCTNFDYAKELFEKHDYKLPRVIFWNVNTLSNQVPVTEHQSGALLVSGATPKIFDMVQNNCLDPYYHMMSIINTERYNQIFA